MGLGTARWVEAAGLLRCPENTMDASGWSALWSGLLQGPQSTGAVPFCQPFLGFTNVRSSAHSPAEESLGVSNARAGPCPWPMALPSPEQGARRRDSGAPM